MFKKLRKLFTIYRFTYHMWLCPVVHKIKNLSLFKIKRSYFLTNITIINYYTYNVFPKFLCDIQFWLSSFFLVHAPFHLIHC